MGFENIAAKARQAGVKVVFGRTDDGETQRLSDALAGIPIKDYSPIFDQPMEYPIHHASSSKENK